MATTEYVGGTGGKFRKRPLRGAPSTPYDRPPEAARGIRGVLPVTEAGGRGWLSRLVDPASRLIARGVFRLFSSVFQKRLTAPAEPPGQNANTTDEVPKVEFTPEIKADNVNTIDARDRLTSNGNESPEQETKSGVDFCELECLLKQKTFTRSETERLKEVIYSRTVGPSSVPSADHKNKGKVSEQSNIDLTSSQPASNHDEEANTNATKPEGSMIKLVRLGGGINSGVNVTIPNDDSRSLIEVAKTYMESKTLREAPSTLGLRSRRIPGDKDAENEYKTPKLHGRSALYKMSRNYKSYMGYGPYREGSYSVPTRSFEATQLSNAIHLGYRQAQKRSSSDRDEGLFSQARRVRQKPSLTNFHLPTGAGTSSPNFIGQDWRKSPAELEGVKDVDGGVPLASVIPVPPRSTEMARKILNRLDKLVPSPINRSSEKKAIVGDASSSKSPVNASLQDGLKISGDDGHRYLKDTSNSVVENISGNPVKAVECSEKLAYSADKAHLSLDGTVTKGSSSVVIGALSTQKEPTLQSAENDKVEHKIEKHAIFTLKAEPREESLIKSRESVPISLIHGEAYANTFSKPPAELDVSSTLKNLFRGPHLSPNMLSTSAEAASSKEGNVNAFKVGSKSTAEVVSKPIIAGIMQSARTKEPIVTCTTSELPEVRGGTSIFARPSNASSLATPVFPSASFQFDSGKLAGISNTSSSKDGNSISGSSSLHPAIGGNGIFSFNASSASSGSSMQFAGKTSLNVAGISSTSSTSIGTWPSSTGKTVPSFSQNSVSQFCSVDSNALPRLGPPFGSGVSPFPAASTNLTINFSSGQPSSLTVMFGSSYPSTSFSYASSSMPFPSPAATTAGFGPESHTEDRAVDDHGEAPVAQDVDQTTTSSAAGAQRLHFGAYRSGSESQSSSPFSAGGSFSFGSGGGDKSERKFIRVRRDKSRKK